MCENATRWCVAGGGIHTAILRDLRAQLGRLFAAFGPRRRAIKFNFPRATGGRLARRALGALPRRSLSRLSPSPRSPARGAAFAPFFSQIHMTAGFLLFPPYQRRYLQHPLIESDPNGGQSSAGPFG